MRGNPFLQTILIVAVFLLAGIPVYRLTRPAEAAASIGSPTPTPVDDHSPANPASLEVEVVSAPAPTDFQITNLGQPVIAGRGPQARFAGRWNGTVPPEGVELVVRAHWPTAGPGAMRVTIRFPGGRTVEKTFWADAGGALEDVFSVPGETPPAEAR